MSHAYNGNTYMSPLQSCRRFLRPMLSIASLVRGKYFELPFGSPALIGSIYHLQLMNLGALGHMKGMPGMFYWSS